VKQEFGTYIRDLLKEHECVIVPQFGGFISNPKTARIDSNGGRIYPPKKIIVFNPRLKENDGILADHAARVQGISYAEAMSQITSLVSELNDSIRGKNQFILTGVGTFYKDTNGILRFRANDHETFDLSAFGLESLTLVKQQKQEIKPSEKDLPEEQEASSIIKMGEASDTHFWKRLAAAVIILPLVLYSLWVSTQTELLDRNGQFQISDLNPFSDKLCASYSERSDLPRVSASGPDSDQSDLQRSLLSEKTFIKARFTDNREIEPITVQLKPHEAAPVTTKVDYYNPDHSLYHYYIVGGCFQYKENAVGFVSKLKRRGYDAIIIDLHKGLYRVGIEGTQTKDLGITRLNALRNEGFKDAWLLRKG
jgi:nucleoid DNA-binding protein